MITLTLASRAQIAEMQNTVTEAHYLHRPVDSRCSVEAYSVALDGVSVGLLMFGRPEATRCANWYGGVDDVFAGRCEVTRWQVLNLARVWFDPIVQPGGSLHESTPGYRDRRGVWRSTLASDAIRLASQRIGRDYLGKRPPCFLDEPYQKNIVHILVLAIFSIDRQSELCYNQNVRAKHSSPHESREKREMSAIEYAKTIYATPEEWGSQTVYGDEPTMQTTIASLIDAGGPEWAGINLGDCAQYELVQVVNGLGLYKEQYVRNENYIALWDGRALPIKMAVRLASTMQENDGYQEVYFPAGGGRSIATYNSLEKAIEEMSE